MKQSGLYGAVPLAHYFLRERLKSGDRVVDATCGNGQDTQLLADLVGDDGQVWGFDIQAEALVRAGERLAAAGLASRVQLIHAGHERLAEFITEPLDAVIFNLGYLPAGDKSVVTGAVTTIAALEQAAGLVSKGGLILIAVYTGHDEGGEWQAVQRWVSELHPHRFNVWQMRQLNRGETAPFLVVVEPV
jgi:SAM-dependent methyltransferase